MARPKMLSPHQPSAPQASLFRLKAIASEQRAGTATDPAQRQEWEELAIEWHLLASLAGAGDQPRPKDDRPLSYYVDSLAGAMQLAARRN